MSKSVVGRLGGKAAKQEPVSRASHSPQGADAAGHAQREHDKRPPQSGQEKSSRRRGGRRKGGEDNASWSLDEFQVEPREGDTRFHDLGLRDELMQGIAALGFQYCSPIQAGICLLYTSDAADELT